MPQPGGLQPPPPHRPRAPSGSSRPAGLRKIGGSHGETSGQQLAGPGPAPRAIHLCDPLSRPQPPHPLPRCSSTNFVTPPRGLRGPVGGGELPPWHLWGFLHGGAGLRASTRDPPTRHPSPSTKTPASFPWDPVGSGRAPVLPSPRVRGGRWVPSHHACLWVRSHPVRANPLRATDLFRHSELGNSLVIISREGDNIVVSLSVHGGCPLPAFICPELGRALG